MNDHVGTFIAGTLLLLIGAGVSYFVFRPGPLAFAQCSPSKGVVPLVVRCDNQSNYHRNVLWDFGETGLPQVKDQEVVRHQYRAPGTYTVKLEAHGQGPSDTWSQPVTVLAATELASLITITVSAQTKENRVVNIKAVPISRTKDDHPSTFGESSKSHTDRAQADDGFRIISARFERSSATRENDVRATVASDGRSAELSYRLTSGPSVDRYRGWLRGTLLLEQEQVEPAHTVELASELGVETFGAYTLSGALSLGAIEGVTISSTTGEVLAVGPATSTLVSRDGTLLFSFEESAGELLLIVADGRRRSP